MSPDLLMPQLDAILWWLIGGSTAMAAYVVARWAWFRFHPRDAELRRQNALLRKALKRHHSRLLLQGWDHLDAMHRAQIDPAKEYEKSELCEDTEAVLKGKA